MGRSQIAKNVNVHREPYTITFGSGGCGINNIGNYDIPYADFVTRFTATIRSDDHANLYIGDNVISDRFDCVWDDHKSPGNALYQTCKFKKEIKISNPVNVKVEVFNVTQACLLESGTITFYYN